MKKHFTPGALKLVSSDNGLEVRYEHAEDETVTSTTYRDGVATFQIRFSKYGAPISGKEFDDVGGVTASYTYDSLGQVEKTVEG